MKILVCVTEYPPVGSGIANVASNVVEQLRILGNDVDVCSPVGPEIRRGSWKLITRTGVMGLLYFWSSVAGSIDGRNYDAVWLHEPYFPARVPFRQGVVTIHTTYHGEYTRGFGGSGRRLYRRIAAGIERATYRRLGGRFIYTGVSPQVCDELRAIGIPGAEFLYIPNGVDTGLFAPRDEKRAARERWDLPGEGKILLSLGRLSAVKDPGGLIRAFGKIVEKGDDVTLVIAGRGEYAAEAEKEAKRAGAGRVRFLGYVAEDDKPSLYNAADYYITASRYEGQPLALLEAISSGLPCIVSDIIGHDVVRDAGCGVLLDFGNTDAAAEAIHRYLGTDPAEHAGNARRYALACLGWGKIAEQYLALFKDVEASGSS